MTRFFFSGVQHMYPAHFSMQILNTVKCINKTESKQKQWPTMFVMHGSSLLRFFEGATFLTREAHAQHELSWVVDKCVARSMGCKLYANEVRSQLTFKLLSIFNYFLVRFLPRKKFESHCGTCVNLYSFERSRIWPFSAILFFEIKINLGLQCHIETHALRKIPFELWLRSKISLSHWQIPHIGRSKIYSLSIQLHHVKISAKSNKTRRN